MTEAEWAFRITKHELAIRPIWHQKQERVLAHILVCFLAYVLWKTLAQWIRVLAKSPAATDAERAAWLKREHGLGHFQARLVVSEAKKKSA